MKKRTKKKLERALLYSLLAVFIAGTFLLYLPVSQTSEQTVPPVDQGADGQQIPPEVIEQLQQQQAQQAPPGTNAPAPPQGAQ